MCSGECSDVANWAEIFIMVGIRSSLCQEGLRAMGTPLLGFSASLRSSALSHSRPLSSIFEQMGLNYCG